MKNIYFITRKRILPVRGFFLGGGGIFYCKINACTLGFPGGSVVKNPPANAGATGKDPLEEKMQPTPVFLPLKFYGQRSVTGYSPWGCKE